MASPTLSQNAPAPSPVLHLIKQKQSRSIAPNSPSEDEHTTFSSILATSSQRVHDIAYWMIKHWDQRADYIKQLPANNLALFLKIGAELPHVVNKDEQAIQEDRINRAKNAFTKATKSTAKNTTEHTKDILPSSVKELHELQILFLIEAAQYNKELQEMLLQYFNQLRLYIEEIRTDYTLLNKAILLKQYITTLHG